MAYTVTHILIAKKILEYIDCTIDYPTYILGAVAPDAVHAAKDFSVEQKERYECYYVQIETSFPTISNIVSK